LKKRVYQQSAAITSETTIDNLKTSGTPISTELATSTELTTKVTQGIVTILEGFFMTEDADTNPYDYHFYMSCSKACGFRISNTANVEPTSSQLESKLTRFSGVGYRDYFAPLAGVTDDNQLRTSAITLNG